MENRGPVDLPPKANSHCLGRFSPSSQRSYGVRGRVDEWSDLGYDGYTSGAKAYDRDLGLAGQNQQAWFVVSSA
jgi:hypothetical protein